LIHLTSQIAFTTTLSTVSYQLGDDRYEERGRGDVAREARDALTQADDDEDDQR